MHTPRQRPRHAVRCHLGRARRQLRRNSEAMRYFVSLEMIDGDWNERPLRRERIARSHERNGRRTEARAALEGLPLIWKDADPDHAHATEARPHLACL